MGFRLFGLPASPIAIDFGASGVKLLQTGLGQRPSLIAAAELPMPMPIGADGGGEETMSLLREELPRIIRTGGFKGKRVVFTIPGRRTVIQHLQIGPSDGMKREDAVMSQLQMQSGIMPRNAVVRCIDVAELNRNGQSKSEVISFAIPRDVVMRYVELLESMRLQVLGVQTEVQAMVRAFDHIHRRQGDENITTMYLDLGWSSTRVAIAHGKQITFARSMPIGGEQFDRLIAERMSCDLAEAMARRLAMPASTRAKATNPSAATNHGANAASRSAGRQESGSDDREDGGGMARLTAAMAKDAAGRESSAEPTIAADEHSKAASDQARERREGRSPAVLPHSVETEEERRSGSESLESDFDLSEVLDTITDELSMCVRYHRGLFPDRAIDRLILLGGEARQAWLCRHIVRELRLPARLGDPLARFVRDDNTVESIGLAENQVLPGWAVASGMCSDSASW
jgi:type IV pilus assembly protein PilM